MLTAEKLVELQYENPRQLPDGRWAALMRMMFTTGLYIVEDEFSWSTRWCYERFSDALHALETWDGTGDPPGDWIVQKPQQRMGPGAKQ
jgi:hypothetical protein